MESLSYNRELQAEKNYVESNEMDKKYDKWNQNAKENNREMDLDLEMYHLKNIPEEIQDANLDYEMELDSTDDRKYQENNQIEEASSGTKNILEKLKTDQNANILQPTSFTGNSQVNENEEMFVRNSEVNDLIKNITAKRPNISIHLVQNPTEEMIANSIARQSGIILRKPDHFEHYKYITPKELQSRLNNVTVTAWPVGCSSSDKFTQQSVEYASPQWFYLRYMSYVNNPTVETCLMASIASCAAAAAYRNPINSNEDMSLFQRIFRVAAEASFYMCANAYNVARQNYLSSLQTFKDVLKLYGLEDSTEYADITKILGFNEENEAA